MARYNQEWDALGRSIQEIVDRAVNSRDYQKLNQTIRQTVERAVDLGSDAVRRAVDDTRRSARKAPVKQAKEVIVESKNVPALYGSTTNCSLAGIFKIIGGGLLSAVGFAGTVSSLFLSLVGFSSSLPVMPLLGLGGGVGLVVSGVQDLSFVSRFKTYRKTLGQKTHCALENLARSVRKQEKFVRRELEKMTRKGFFLEGHLDREGSTFITSHETYRYFEQSRLQLEERQRMEAAEQAKREEKKFSPQVQEVLDKGDAYIAKIRSCNDAIPGQEISEKIFRMEQIVGMIFDRAEAHPEIIPDLKKMMDYYLPMTVKLLDAYADMDAQPIQGETIQSSKREIEETLDTLNLAFEKLLDSVFEDTALDISSDISVLQTLLAQEGLTEDDLSKMKKNM